MKHIDDAKSMISYIRSRFQEILNTDKEKSEYIKKIAEEADARQN